MHLTQIVRHADLRLLGRGGSFREDAPTVARPVFVFPDEHRGADEIRERPPRYLRNLEIINKPANEGKGVAIRSGLDLVKGDIVIIQDADLELNPAEYPKLLKLF